jgi:hypothetical protein
MFVELLKGFEDARERHLPSQSQQPIRHPSPASLPPPPPSLQPPIHHRNHRSSKRIPFGGASARSAAVIATEPISEVDLTTDSVESQLGSQSQYLNLEYHINHNINAVWQKLDDYYNRSDATPIYRAAVLLHLRMKWRWFERYWASKPTWIADARTAIADLWSEYKATTTATTTTATTSTDLLDEWSNDDSATTMDQLELYEHELYANFAMTESPIAYWVSKRPI